jgi:hypothetical protein
MKLQVRPHSLTTLATTTTSSTKGIELTPDSRTLGVELINSRVTLLKSMLLANHRQVESITGRLIALAKANPHLRNST